MLSPNFRQCPPMHRFSPQSQRSGATQEDRNPLRQPQTHPRSGMAPTTRSMRQSGGIYPRSHYPKPPETRNAQANATQRQLKWRPHLRHLNEIREIAQTGTPKSVTFSTKSAPLVGSPWGRHRSEAHGVGRLSTRLSFTCQPASLSSAAIRR